MPNPIVDGLVGPLQLDVGHHGIFVAQSFIGTLSKVKRDGTVVDIVTEPGWGLNGVAAGRHRVAYTITQFDPETFTTVASLLKVVRRDGSTRVIADLFAFEERRNPDRRNTYGFRNLDEECAAQVPPELAGEPYKGLVDSNPYALAKAHGGWYVADAGGNDILWVSKKGDIKVVYVAKPQPVVVTAEGAAALGLPECTIGSTYAFEPVPTDVEVRRTGRLVVSLLPGGPESEALGARGSVIVVNPHEHEAWVLAKGLLGATNVALGPHAKVYVTELFGNRVSVIRSRHHVEPLVELPSPAAVEYAHGKLFVSYDVFANGTIATIRPHHRDDDD